MYQILKWPFPKKVQFFYDFPFEAIRNKMSTETVQRLFPILAQIPTQMYDVQDMIWFIDATIRDVQIGDSDFFASMAPTDYGVQSKRNFPCLFA